jgi:hypothetical protein
MAEGMRPNVVFTPDEYAAAAFSDQMDGRFTWGRLKKNAAFVRPFIEYVQKHRDQMIVAALRRATVFLDVRISPGDIPINFVCGGPWDAYGLLFQQSERLFFDVGLLADGPLAKVLPDFESILAHEVWHLAFLEHQKEHWPVAYRGATDPAFLFLYEMLNEGIAHYYSMSHKLAPTITIPDLPEKERRVFALLEARYPRWRDDPDEKHRADELWHSHAGVPFWEKWGAIPAALVVHHLVDEGGYQSVARLIAREPFSLFIAYDQKCAEHPEWPRLPESLVEDARRGLRNHTTRLGTRRLIGPSPS